MNAAQSARLRLIDFLLEHYGSFGRAALMDYSGIGPAQATIDIRLYVEAAPHNAVFDHVSKLYLRSTAFTRKFP